MTDYYYDVEVTVDPLHVRPVTRYTKAEDQPDLEAGDPGRIGLEVMNWAGWWRGIKWEYPSLRNLDEAIQRCRLWCEKRNDAIAAEEHAIAAAARSRSNV